MIENGSCSNTLVTGGSTMLSHLYQPGDIISVKLVDGKLEVVLRVKSMITYTVYPPRDAPDYIYKDIYVSWDGKIALEKTIRGTHTPAYTVPESFDFDEDEGS